MRFVVLTAVVGAVGVASYVWYDWRLRRLVAARLTSALAHGAAPESRQPGPHRRVPTFPTRYRVVPMAVGTTIGVFCWIGAGLPVVIAAAVGTLTGVMAFLVEVYTAEKQEALIETQLSAAIDLLVGSLRAGAGLLAAFDSALQEAAPPLRPYFQEVAGRIRLGDDPRAAVSDLQVRVPLETFRLFATALVIHWEVGGSLATTLTTVGATIRDRIELARRVRAQGVESNASVAVVLVISYVLGFLMWRTNPDRMEAFVQTGIGTLLIAGVISLQAVGLIWMSRLSRSTF